ncbi:MAG: NAD(P)-dependent alcohol dehydrogenase [Gammaproteobacteria bacterium]|nr:NAD(P)-dependent alcohol dehydrogenase [Gammaproteobacteria bacterium]
MKAIVINKFGTADALEVVTNHPKPAILDNQVLIQVHAAGVNPLDYKARKGQLKALQGSNFPLVLGNDASGVVAAVGASVTQFKVGDEVFAFTDASAKPSWTGFAESGAYAEFAVTREDTLALKPKQMSHIEAASMPLAALTAYQALQKVGLKAGMNVLVNGASGGVGIFAVQLAKHAGCQVTGLCSERNFEMVKNLGADAVIDYKTSPIAALEEQYDVVYDVADTTSYMQCRHLLSPTGVYISNANLTKPLNMLSTWLFPLLGIFGLKQRTNFAWVTPSGKDLSAIAKIVDQGALHTVIDSSYEMTDASAAHQRCESGRVAGKVVIVINQNSAAERDSSCKPAAS